MDTLAISRRLREAGLEQPAAEAITSAIRDAVDSHAASKADLDLGVERLQGDIGRLAQRIGQVEQKLDNQVERIDQKIEIRVQRLELKLTWWIIGAGGVFALLQIAARYFLP